MKAIDLFCGAGGLSRGLLDSGLHVVAGIDIDDSLAKTYEWNNRPSSFLPADIRSLHPELLVELLDGTSPEDALLAGCAPCRAFSKQRRDRPGRHPDATLLGAFGRLIQALLPGWVLMENVPGLTAVPGFSSFRRFLQMLERSGYHVAQGVLNAADFGVPQHRQRYVLMASRRATPELPVPSHGPQRIPCETVRFWISHFPPIEAGEAHATVPNHVASPLSEINMKRIKATPVNGGDRRSWPDSFQLDCHRDRSDSFSDVYGRMWWDRVAPTLTGRCNSLSNGRFGHPEQDRAVSLREAASLQTFPDDYRFFGLNSHIARHIGNAVPVRLAEALGRSVLSCA